MADGSAGRAGAVRTHRTPPTPSSFESLLARVTARCAPSALLYLPVTIALVYVVVLLAEFGSIVAGIDQNADSVVPGELARLIAAHHGTVWLGDSAWYATLLFEVATRGLPFFQLLWDVAPFVVAAVSFGAVAWSVWRVAGRWASAIALSLLVCADLRLLTILGALNNHAFTWMCDSLLIAGLVWVLDPVHSPARSRWVPAAIALALVTAVSLASDPLLEFGGIVPVLVGAIVARRRWPQARTRDGVGYAVLTGAIAVGGSLVLVHVMHQQHIVPTPSFSVGLAQSREVPANLSLWIRSLATLGGMPDVATFEFRAPLVVREAAGLLTVAAVALIAHVVFSQSRRRPADAIKRAATSTPNTPARDAFVVAWGASATLLSAAFVLSTAPSGLETDRYLVGVVIAAAALAPLLATRRWAAIAIALAATIYCSSGLFSILSSTSTLPTRITSAQAATFTRVAQQEHAHEGFTDYWDAATITWATHFHLKTFPVAPCLSGICRYENGAESAWYTTDRAERTFLVVNSAQPGMERAPASLGRPAASIRVGRNYKFLVYDYDLATRIGR